MNPTNDLQLETSFVGIEDVRRALEDASIDIFTSYRFSHKATKTTLFIGNDFFPANSSIIWLFHYFDKKTQTSQLYKKIEQKVIIYFRSDESNHDALPIYPQNVTTSTITNDVLTDFLQMLQRFYPDIQVEKITPTLLESMLVKASTEKKEMEQKLIEEKYNAEFEIFQQAAQKKFHEEDEVEEVENNPTTNSPTGTSSTSSISSTSSTSSIPLLDSTSTSTSCPSISDINGLRVFQDSKLQEQMVIIYNEISKEF